MVAYSMLTVQDPYGLCGLFQSSRYSPHVTTAVDIPLRVIASSLGSKAVVSMLAGIVHAIIALGTCMRVAMLGTRSTELLVDSRANVLDYIL